MPAAQSVEFVAADFYVELLHGNESGERGDFILRRKDDVDHTDRLREAKLFKFREALGQHIFLVEVHARIRNSLVEGNFRRPLRDGVSALRAFVQADVHGVDFVDNIRGAFYEQVG